MSWLKNTLTRKKGAAAAAALQEESGMYADMSLEEFLVSAGLDSERDRTVFMTMFQTKGAFSVDDATLLSEQDLEESGILPIQRRRFSRAKEAWLKACRAGINRPVVRGQPSANAPPSAGPVSPGAAAAAAAASATIDIAALGASEAAAAAAARSDGGGGGGGATRGGVNPALAEHDYLDPDAGAYVNTQHLPLSHPIHTADTVSSNPQPGFFNDHELGDVPAIIPDEMYEMPDQAARGGVGPDGGPAVPRRRAAELMVVPDEEPLPPNPREWNSAEVLRWLNDVGLKDFKDIFYNNGFMGKHLFSLVASHFTRAKFSQEQCEALKSQIDILKSTPQARPAPASAAAAAAAVSHQLSKSHISSPNHNHSNPAAGGGGESGGASGAAPRRICRATHPFQGNRSKHLSCNVGDEFVIKNDSKRWWLVTSVSDPSKTGLLPMNHVEVIPSGPPAAPPRSGSSSSSHSPMGGAGAGTATSSSAAAAAAASPAAAPPAGDESWLHDDINDRRRAEARLAGMPPGSFLIRRGSSAGYTLTAVGESGGFVHLRIEETGGRYVLGKSESSSFYTLADLVAHYRRNAIKVANRERLLLVKSPRKP